MSFPFPWLIGLSDVRTRKASTIQAANRVHSVCSGAAETDLQARGLIRYDWRQSPPPTALATDV